MYKVTPYFKSDFFNADIINFEDLAGLDKNGVAHGFLRGPGWTIRHNNRIVAMGGVMKYWPGVGEAWFVATEWTKDHKLYVLKTTKRILRSIFIEHKFNRIQTSVLKDWETANKFARWMGFREEGEMPWYGAEGQTHIRYAITREVI